jgi:hypothetical protein
MSNLELEAQRWRKLEAMIRASFDGAEVSTDTFNLHAHMVFGRGNHRRVAVSFSFVDRRDEPVDFATAIDRFPWPDPADEASGA